ncbi:hypothetical protein ACKF11_11080 [Methylobacillus sp. Pita2]|uniref:hypothetical protein n=1 Tax=Methylobacillus sp. Pita2 TaxID=3383245 RepID=UPI0038B661ED
MTLLPSRHIASIACTALLSFMLAGCMGGPIAQQVASSLLMRAADQATSNAYDAYLLKDPSTSSPGHESSTTATIPGHGGAIHVAPSSQSQIDEYWIAFLNAGFTEIKPSAEPLPEHAASASKDESHAMTASELVAIEVWSTLVGEEKTAVLERARLLGNDLPQIQELAQWQMAVGASIASPQSPITFLVPPELGRISSGQELLVEISGQNDLNIARYLMQPQHAFQQASGHPAVNQR